MSGAAHSAAAAAPASPLEEAIRGLLGRDPFSRRLGIALVRAAPGSAHLTMPVAPANMNAHGSCHGGALWTLADMVFGSAGYYDGPILTAGSDLTFLRPAPAVALVHATATEVSRKGRTGVFHIVLSQDPADAQSVIATGTFTGRWLASGPQDVHLQADL